MTYSYYVTPKQYEEAEKNGIDPRLLNSRVRSLGWEIERAMQEPKRKKSKPIPKEWVELAKKNGISRDTLRLRLSKGMEEKEAATRPIMTREEVRELSYKKIRIFDPELLKVAIKNGIKERTFKHRVYNGMDQLKAATMPTMTKKEASQLAAIARKKERERLGY